MKIRKLTSPISEEEARSLVAGEMVALSGELVTARDEAHMRALQLHREGKDLPFQMEGRALYHCGPIMSRTDRWEVVAAGPTTSARMDSLEPEFLRAFRPRLILGKGGMSPDVLRTLAEVGCAYLAFTGGAAVLAAKHLPEVLGVYWEDLGMPEAVWRMKAQDLGPLVVAMDAHGRSLFQEIDDKVKKNAASLLL
ncbi:MAG: FumA C-terminus/TtdB family hydratase beta subunit [Methanomassiliicoccales archaeon]|nr:FumA C-terminus/TtdB family hydratase beta subunit [Methanomassiliicoccales archaeon]